MTIDEAIKHAEEIAEKKESERQKWDEWLEHDRDYRATAEKESCELCAIEHRQLAEWLRELKKLREQTELEKCGVCISRQAVNKLVDELARAISDEKCHIQRGRNYGRIIHDILELPSVEPERKNGKWVNVDGSTNSADCSCCGNRGRAWMNYCYLCGAKMKEVNADADSH